MSIQNYIFCTKVCYACGMGKGVNDVNFFSARECAVMLSVLFGQRLNRRHIYYLIDMAEIIGVSVGGQYRIPLCEVKNYYERGKAFLCRRLGRTGRDTARNSFRKRGRRVPVCKCTDDLPPHIKRAVKRIQGDRRDWV